MARLRGQHRVQQQHRLQIEESNIRPSGGEFWGAIDDKVSDWEAKRRNQRADEAPYEIHVPCSLVSEQTRHRALAALLVESRVLQI